MGSSASVESVADVTDTSPALSYLGSSRSSLRGSSRSSLRQHSSCASVRLHKTVDNSISNDCDETADSLSNMKSRPPESIISRPSVAAPPIIPPPSCAGSLAVAQQPSSAPSFMPEFSGDGRVGSSIGQGNRTVSNAAFGGLPPSEEPADNKALNKAKNDPPDIKTLIKEMSIDDVVSEISRRMGKLQQLSDYTTEECKPDLLYVREACSTKGDNAYALRTRIGERLAQCDVTKLFSDILRQCSAVDFTSKAIKRPYLNMKSIIIVFWNCTDQSDILRQSVLADGMLKEIFSYLEDDRFYCREADYLVRGLMGILHNMVQHVEQTKEAVRQCRGVEILQKVYNSAKTDMCKCKSIILLAYIINDEENEQINSDDKNIAFIIKILVSSLKTADHYSSQYGFNSEEAIAALNKLASNDSNKIRIVNQGALPHYVKLLQQDCSVLEQKTAANGIWSLSFKCKDQILKEPGCIEALHYLEKCSDDIQVQNEAKGALWILEDRTTSTEPTTPGSSEGKKDIAPPAPSRKKKSARKNKLGSKESHIMISYQWDCKPVMLRVRDLLKREGYDVWMDIDSMSGSVLAAMALAVEKAEVVIVALSDMYKESTNCRTEAEYAFRLHKEIVPVRVEPHYYPDGWLGALAGSKLCFDLSVDDKVQDSLPGLLKEIKIKMNPLEAAEAPPAAYDEPGYGMITPTRVNQTFTAVKTLKTAVDGWTETDVLNWLEKTGLSAKRNCFHDFDGGLLLEYRETLKTAPEYYYSTLRDQMHFSLLEVLKFTKALKGL